MANVHYSVSLVTLLRLAPLRLSLRVAVASQAQGVPYEQTWSCYEGATYIAGCAALAARGRKPSSCRAYPIPPNSPPSCNPFEKG
jgi:7-cyano-7-deazaguanine synthase in queuosine biosynthesis